MGNMGIMQLSYRLMYGMVKFNFYLCGSTSEEYWQWEKAEMRGMWGKLILLFVTVRYDL